MPFTIRNDATGQLLQLEGQPAAGMEIPGFTFLGQGGIEQFGGPMPFHQGLIQTIGQVAGLFQQSGGTAPPAPTVSGVAGDLIQQATCALFPSLQQCQGMFPNTMPNPFQDVATIVQQANCLPAGPCPPGKQLRSVKARSATTICAKKPRMNVLNPRALRRAAKRLGGFQKEVRSVEKIINKALPRRTARRASTSRCGTCRQSPCGC